MKILLLLPLLLMFACHYVEPDKDTSKRMHLESMAWGNGHTPLMVATHAKSQITFSTPLDPDDYPWIEHYIACPTCKQVDFLPPISTNGLRKLGYENQFSDGAGIKPAKTMWPFTNPSVEKTQTIQGTSMYYVEEGYDVVDTTKMRIIP